MQLKDPVSCFLVRHLGDLARHLGDLVHHLGDVIVERISLVTNVSRLAFVLDG